MKRTAPPWLAWAASGLLAGCAAVAAGDTGSPPSSTSRVGAVLLTPPGAPRPVADKVIVVSFMLSGTGLAPAPTLVAHGSTGALPSMGADIHVELVSRNDAVLHTLALGDPRVVFAENEGIVTVPAARLTARLPFDPAADRARVRDRSGAVLVETDVASAVLAFCSALEDDAECEAALATLRDDGR